MKIPSEQFWVTLVAGVVVTVCVVLIIITALRQRRRMGQYPEEFRDNDRGMGWFAFISWLWFGASAYLGVAVRRSFPLYVIIPGVDLAITLAYLALAGFAITWAFRVEWNRQIGLTITYHMLFPALYGCLVIRDIFTYWQMAWIWIPAVLLAIFLTPFCTRYCYVEFYLNRAGLRDTHYERRR